MSKRPYKPTRLKILEGKAGKIGNKAIELGPGAQMPKCPAWLDDDARRTWKVLGPKLVKIGLMNPDLDIYAFEVLCVIKARVKQVGRFIQERLRQGGDLQHNGRSHPLTRLEGEYMKLFRQYAKEFGLTPVGRIGLKLGVSDHDDDPLGILPDEKGYGESKIWRLQPGECGGHRA